MTEHAYQKLIDIISDAAEPFETQQKDYSLLLDRIGESRFVLIGEATHGTREFYQTRMEITKQLIEKKNFMAVAIEGDWPDVYRIHRYLQGKGETAKWENALSEFERFPTWMWRNETMPAFLQWLRSYNDSLSPENKKGFYGLDLYSLNNSAQAVIKYLTEIDPDAAQNAKLRYACFDHFKMDPQTYGYLTSIHAKKPCIQEAILQLVDIQHHAFDYIKNDDLASHEEYFYAAQNARLVKNAEHYYRAMFAGNDVSWNIRDQHMTETVNVLADHLENRFKQPAKIVIWAHNSHVGDARATEMSERGEINLGHLMREEHDRDVYNIGFSTYEGTVTAASDWGEPSECKQIVPALKDSYEELFHHVKPNNFLLNLTRNETLDHYLKISRLQRAIGVIYRPETERQSHYFYTRLPWQFDSIIHFDKTNALKPLDPK